MPESESIPIALTINELFTNAIKHSGAEKININAWRNDDWFYLRVSDNGSGRADPEAVERRAIIIPY